VFNQRVEEVKEWRNEEKKSGYKRWKRAQDFCKVLNEIPPTQTKPKGGPKQQKVEEEHDDDEDEDSYRCYCDEDEDEEEEDEDEE